MVYIILFFVFWGFFDFRGDPKTAQIHGENWTFRSNSIPFKLQMITNFDPSSWTKYELFFKEKELQLVGFLVASPKSLMS